MQKPRGLCWRDPPLFPASYQTDLLKEVLQIQGSIVDVHVQSGDQQYHYAPLLMQSQWHSGRSHRLEMYPRPSEGAVSPPHVSRYQLLDGGGYSHTRLLRSHRRDYLTKGQPLLLTL